MPRASTHHRRPRGVCIHTVGHSTRPIGEFLAVLRSHRIEVIIDVRRFPGSRRLPQYGQVALQEALAENDIAYGWIPALGGRRRPDPDSPNTAWRHSAFRGYADHAASEEFAEGLFELLMLAPGLRSAIMCAEVLWWRCHRRIIADVLTSLGTDVMHIRTEKAAEAHRLGEPARLVRGSLTYSLTKEQ